MTQTPDMFGMPLMEERILNEIKRLGATYRNEISKNLRIDKITVDRWTQRLIQDGYIEKINLSSGPESHIVARLDELKASGMKKNHFKNAVWYRIKEVSDGRN